MGAVGFGVSGKRVIGKGTKSGKNDQKDVATVVEQLLTFTAHGLLHNRSMIK